MSKIKIYIAILLMSFCANYFMYTSLQKNKQIIDEQKQNISSLNKELEIGKVVSKATDEALNTVVKEIDLNNISYNVIREELPTQPKCINKNEEHTNEAFNDLDDVARFYDSLHSAYRLQTKD